MIEGLKRYDYLERLRILGLTTLETRFVKADLIKVYKIFNGLDSLDPGEVFCSGCGCDKGAYIIVSIYSRFVSKTKIGD